MASLSNIAAPLLVFGAIAFCQVPAPSSNLVNILVRTDLRCLFSVDGGQPRKSDPSAPVIIRVNIGDHTATAVSADGQDLWEGEFRTDRGGSSFTIALLAARAERTRKESEVAALRLQTTRVGKEIDKARERNAILASQSQARTASIQDRDLIVRMITALEKKYAAENQLAENYRRLAGNISSQPQLSQNSAAALGGLINTGFSLNATQNFTLHSQRANQILSCINNLTQELGGSTIIAFHKSLPEVCSLDDVHRFGLSHTTSSGGYHSGALEISANHIQWVEQKKQKDDFSLTCAEIKGYGTVRGLFSIADELVDGNQFYITTKKHYAFRAGDRSGRENVLEALRLTCPRP